ncbi:ABC transporter ATP-binding protein [Roseibacillus ishigakijimensis]|uniref:ABC transporter ATP-binding protein n=1 Tax=Roseibacillus ishigakijimensis TaxID=454146 RepID=A0A934RQL7_9BACT|nr:ABC transporter ATP-binding protein [Roseibacillus ishigakijimensis]MBK1833653.1 ABC transporter ATP-binding protein [Roseibacillus ishigakijimensis]
MSAIRVQNLYRYFGPLKAVDGISFEVPHGSVCGFVGANGAGKTTTMRILATLDYPTMGTAEVCGINVVHHPDKVRELIGWMPDHFGNYEHMTVLEYLDFYARALGYRGTERRERIQEVMDFTDLEPLADRLSNKLSKGQTQRLGLGRALLHDPQILIMDEPAAGLDPKARVELKHLIRILAEEGKTIFISSHILSELGEMCDSLLFVNGGRIVHHGDADSLKLGSDATGGVYYDVRLASRPEALQDWALLNPEVEFVEERKQGGRIRLASAEPAKAAEALRRMVKEGLEVVEYHREERNLEDAFIDILGRLEEGAPPILSPVEKEK